MAATRKRETREPVPQTQTVQDLLRDVPPGEYDTTARMVGRKLSEWGNRLPIGRAEDGAVTRDVILRRPDMDLDLSIAPLRRDEELGRYPGRLIAAILAETAAKIHGVDLLAMPPAVRWHFVGQLTFADVSVLALLRAHSRKAFRRAMIPASPRICRACEKPIARFQLDADSIAIPTWDWSLTNPPRAVVHLTEPLVLGKLKTTKLVLGPATWSRAVGDLTDAQFKTTEIMDYSIGVASIVAGEDGDESGPWSVQPSSTFRRLSSCDGAAVAEAARLVGGQVFAVAPFACPWCGAENHVGLGLQNLDLGFS